MTYPAIDFTTGVRVNAFRALAHIIRECILEVWSCYGINRAQEEIMTYDELKLRIAGIAVTGIDGKIVALESLWRARRVVLVFLRHFG
jgi:hypothetical protein